MRQLDFFTPVAPTNTANHARGATLEEQFAAFHEANPHVYTELRKMALAMVQRGYRRIGVKMLFEVLRYRHAMTTSDPSSEFKLNNNYTSFYARLLMCNEPALDGAFELRTQTWQAAEIG